MKYELHTLPDKRARDWSLVLAAMNIPYTLEKHEGFSNLTVPDEFIDEARKQIGLFEQENTGEGAKTGPGEAGASPLIPVLAVFTALFFFQACLYQSGAYDSWVDAGNSSNINIRAGEIWRIFTAITLHADIGHFLSNAIMGGVIFYCLFSITGAGAGLFMALIAGSAGNLATALVIPSEYHSIGASGSIFGAFGILASYRIFLGRPAAGKPDWKPAAAALTFLGLFGTSAGSDFLGHFFSLLAGFLTGFAGSALTKAAGEKQPRGFLGVIFGLTAVLIITISWMKAIGGL